MTRKDKSAFKSQYRVWRKWGISLVVAKNAWPLYLNYIKYHYGDPVIKYNYDKPEPFTVGPLMYNYLKHPILKVE